jgi:hypothetical protein
MEQSVKIMSAIGKLLSAVSEMQERFGDEISDLETKVDELIAIVEAEILKDATGDESPEGVTE